MNRGPLFRLLRLERRICPSCHRDNVRRSGLRTGWATGCRWCGAPMVDWVAFTRSIQELSAINGISFQRGAEAAQAAMHAFGEAMGGFTYVVDVETATHDDLKAGETATRYSRVQVMASDEDEAKLVACQVAATGGRMPTRATVRSPSELRAEEQARQLFQVYRLDNPLGHAVELRKDVP